MLWILCQIAIVACDMAEMIGTAFALKLLFGIPLLVGICLGAVVTLLILLLEHSKTRGLQAVIIALSGVVAFCIFADVVLAQPSLTEVFAGLIPSSDIFADSGKLLLTVGIVGATVMPHNLYLHSSLVNRVDDRQASFQSSESKQGRLRWFILDSSIALLVAFFVNAGILILAAATFKASGQPVSDIRDAYYFLTPLLGSSIASVLFGLALLAAGQSSTVTVTMTGSIVAQGFLGLRFNPWISRLVTRISALVPAVFVIVSAGEDSLTHLLVLSQVVLSFQLPFAIFPLIHFCSQRRIMASLVAPRWLTVIAVFLGALLVVLDAVLIYETMSLISPP
jgi:manganese transport protein